MIPLPLVLEKFVNECIRIYKQQGIDGVALMILAIFVMILGILRMFDIW